MKRGRPAVLGKDKVVIRVILPVQDYEALDKIAELERTDISSLVRRAIARFYLIADEAKSDSSAFKHQGESNKETNFS